MTVPQNDLTHPPVVWKISPCTLGIGSKKFTPAAPVCEPTRTKHRPTQPTDAVANTSHPTDGAFHNIPYPFWRKKQMVPPFQPFINQNPKLKAEWDARILDSCAVNARLYTQAEKQVTPDSSHSCHLLIEWLKYVSTWHELNEDERYR